MQPVCCLVLFRNLSIAISTSSVVGLFNHSFLSSSSSSDLFLGLHLHYWQSFLFQTVLEIAGLVFLEYHVYYLLILHSVLYMRPWLELFYHVVN